MLPAVEILLHNASLQLLHINEKKEKKKKNPKNAGLFMAPPMTFRTYKKKILDVLTRVKKLNLFKRRCIYVTQQ